MPLEEEFKRAIESNIAYRISAATRYDPIIVESERKSLKFESAFDFYYGHIIGEISQEMMTKFLTTYKRLPMSDEAVEMISLMMTCADQVRTALKHLNQVS